MTDSALLASLLERVQLLEDKAAIHEVLTAYGPAVDAGDAEAVGELWAEDAVYDVDIRLMEGRDAIMKMVRTRPHQDYIEEGCGHLLDPVHIRVDGDTAVATCHSLLLRRNADPGRPRARPVSVPPPATPCCCAATPIRIRSGCGG